MHWFSIGVANLAAVTIIAVGFMYLLAPRAATRSFDLPLPEPGPNVAWWLRLKGSRDVVSGLRVFAVLAWGDLRLLGFVLLVEALIPVGDMTLVLASCGFEGACARSPRRHRGGDDRGRAPARRGRGLRCCTPPPAGSRPRPSSSRN